MKTENMKAVVESIRFKYCFKKEVNNENNRNSTKPQRQISFIKRFLDDKQHSNHFMYVIILCNCLNKTVRFIASSYPYT